MEEEKLMKMKQKGKKGRNKEVEFWPPHLNSAKSWKKRDDEISFGMD